MHSDAEKPQPRKSPMLLINSKLAHLGVVGSPTRLSEPSPLTLLHSVACVGLALMIVLWLTVTSSTPPMCQAVALIEHSEHSGSCVHVVASSSSTLWLNSTRSGLLVQSPPLFCRPTIATPPCIFLPK